ncbi:MAG: transcriptional regulator NrdR [Candidatus Aenigmatarchaeota archaeon]|nr:transcriptional regulator NrdR [Candidatus Aenigmarchaeota archaeon]
MRCPYCNSEKIKVIDKRPSDNKTFRRRRECQKCHKRFTTYERIELVPLTVIKRDGRREAFDRNKIRIGIMKACEKRPISQEKIEKIVDEIENELRNMDTTEIKSKVIGDMVIEKLKSLDEVAYIRFASVYKKFKAIEDFEKELKALKG